MTSATISESRRAVVLVSGGMDSCVTAAILNSRGCELNFLHVNYGQRTEARELTAFHELARHFGVRRRLVTNFPYLADIGGSSLTDAGTEVSPANLAANEIP